MRTRSSLFCVLVAALVCGALPPEAAGAADWKFSTSVNYATGRYGTQDRIDTVSVPFTLKRYYSGANISVTLPYLSQSSTGRVVWAGGGPVRGAKGSAAVATSGESGFGDLLLRGAYALKQEGPGSFDLALAGKLKLPTADEHKGLGTGEMDEGVGLEFSKEITPRWSLLADGYYTLIGDPDGQDYNNQVALDIGFYRPLPKNLGLTVLYETQNALIDGNADPRSLSGTLSYLSPGGAQFFCGLALGMSDGSPDTGVSAGLALKF